MVPLIRKKASTSASPIVVHNSTFVREEDAPRGSINDIRISKSKLLDLPSDESRQVGGLSARVRRTRVAESAQGPPERGARPWLHPRAEATVHRPATRGFFLHAP